jgi:catechol 2,3-dioxygenase-like lactoylglutathione lyase family enzyme
MRVQNHIGLAVRDPSRSLRFYRDTLGLQGSVREEAYGFVISAANGVDFTLLSGRSPADVGTSISGSRCRPRARSGPCATSCVLWE